MMTDSGSAPPSSNYYQLLGVPAQATSEEIRDRFRQLAQQIHPDKLATDLPERLRLLAQQDFLRLREAYRILLDPERRAAYDLSLLPQPIQSLSPRPLPPSIAQPQPQPAGFNWQMPLACSLLGSALTLGAVALWNLTQTPAPQVSQVAPTEPVAINPAPVAPPAPAQPDPFKPTQEQLTQFVSTVRQIEPLMKTTNLKLDQATSASQRREIEQGFELAATKLIESNGLTTEQYQQISLIAREDPSVRSEVTKVAQKLAADGTP